MIQYTGKFCIIMLLALPLYLLIRRPWRREAKREWAMALFALWNLGLLVLALEGEYGSPAEMAGNAAARLATGEGVNLVPFRTIAAFFRHFHFDIFAINVVGNTVIFIPWGFGLPLLWERNRRIPRLLLFAAALPLFIEVSQLFIGRNVDVDDWILNFAGGCLGAAVYFGLVRRFPGYFQGLR